VTLGNITRSVAGGVVDFTLPASGNMGVTGVPVAFSVKLDKVSEVS